jgi:hypothetical protein
LRALSISTGNSAPLFYVFFARKEREKENSKGKESDPFEKPQSLEKEIRKSWAKGPTFAPFDGRVPPDNSSLLFASTMATKMVELDVERGEAPMEDRSFGHHHHHSHGSGDNTNCVVGGLMGFIFGIFGFLCGLCIEREEDKKNYFKGAAVGCVISGVISLILYLAL